jgi:hypothetical protein
LSRPPRRVEFTLPEPLLRHFAVVNTPPTQTLGPGGMRLVLDAVDRGGALLFVTGARHPPAGADLELLAEVARGDAAVFCAVVAKADSDDVVGAGVEGRHRVDAEAALAAHRAAALAAVPNLDGARWFALAPPGADLDPTCLRRALVDWSGSEGLRRASSSPPVLPGATRTVALDGGGSGGPDWAELLDRRSREAARRLRQHLALELADIHLRRAQELVSDAGCPGLPEALDRDLHGLSLRVVAECDEAAEAIVDGTVGLLIGGPPEEGVRRRVAAAISWGLREHHAFRDLDRVLLVTAEAGISVRTGPAAAATLAACPGGGGALLPPVGVAVAGGCYRFWRDPANTGAAAARSWLQRSLREVEVAFSRELARRITAVACSLSALLEDSTAQGVLLA